MTIRQQLRSGAFFKGLQAMVLLGSRSRTAVHAVAPVPPARHTSMKGRPFLYLQVLGVAPQFQGSGFDAKLLDALVERSEQTGAALYTETTLERAANLYERHGFKAINRTALPVLDLPLWEFVREPSAR